MTVKELISGLYWFICLVALTGEPTGEKTAFYYAVYYAFFIVNIIIATAIINKQQKNVATKNANRIY